MGEGGGGEAAIRCLKWIGSSYPGELLLSQLLRAKSSLSLRCNSKRILFVHGVCLAVAVRGDGSVCVLIFRFLPRQASLHHPLFKRGHGHRWEASQLTVCEMNVISLFFFITNTDLKQMVSCVGLQRLEIPEKMKFDLMRCLQFMDYLYLTHFSLETIAMLSLLYIAQ